MMKMSAFIKKNISYKINIEQSIEHYTEDIYTKNTIFTIIQNTRLFKKYCILAFLPKDF